MVVPQKSIIVLGIDTPIGLAIIRELGLHGLHVIGIGRNKRAIGLYSRFLSKGHIRPTDLNACLELIQTLSQTHGGAPVLAISETDIELLNRNRDILLNVPLLIPSAERFTNVINKNKTQEIARRVCLPLPATWTIASLAELKPLTEQLTFPVILKWQNPHEVSGKLRALGLSLFKAKYCYDAEDLKRTLAVFSDVGTFPMIQEFCQGHGLGQMLFMHQGQALLRFQHERLHEWPPEGGFSSLCRAVPLNNHKDLMAKSETLLKALEWEGPAMVEYRWDERTGIARFMEVNGRFWGSLPLAFHCGAPFAWLTYCVWNKDLPELGPIRYDLKCRYVIPDVKRLTRIVFQPELIENRELVFRKISEITNFLLSYLDPKMRYYVFMWRDPKPMIMDLWFIVQKFLKIS